MTSAVLILSMLPVALQLGEGGESRAPLGAVLVGGMATSTFLSLLYVPVAYTYFDSLGTLVGRIFSFKLRLPSWRRSASDVIGGSRRPVAALPVAGGSPLAAERVEAARGQLRRSRQQRPARHGRALAPHPSH